MVLKVELYNDVVVVLELDVDVIVLVFFFGQYVNIGVLGIGQYCLYLFLFVFGELKISFFIKKIFGGVMSCWLEIVQLGDKFDLYGLLGSFYLCNVQWLLLFFVGGMGLVLFLLMFEVLVCVNLQQKVYLIYGVICDFDLVQVDVFEVYVVWLLNFSYVMVVVDVVLNYLCKGWVMQYVLVDVLNDGDVDVYLCGLLLMVDVVCKYFDDEGVKFNSFYYEKFMFNVVLEVKVV